MDAKRPKGLFFKNKMQKRTNVVVFQSKDVNMHIRFFWESAFGVLLPRLGRKLTKFIKIETDNLLLTVQMVHKLTITYLR